MANPNLRNYTTQRDWSWSVQLADTAAQNLIGNASASNSVIKVDVWAWNVDGSVPVDVSVSLRDQAGTPVCSQAGDGAVTTVTTSTDVVAGADLGGPYRVSLPSQAGMQFIRRFTLTEGRSLVFTASNGGDAAIWLDYSVFTDQ